MKHITFFGCLMLLFTMTLNAQHLTTMEELELLEQSRSANQIQNSNSIDISELLNRQIPAGNQVSNFKDVFTSNEASALGSFFRSQNRDVMAEIIPTAGATETFNVIDGDFFYDPTDGVNGGPGGVCTGTSSGDPGDYPNCGCVTVTTLTATDLSVTFLSFNVFGTFDWLKIYDGANTASPLLYDSNTNATADTYAGMVALVGNPPVFTSTGGSLTFEFNATAVVNSCGWEAEISTAGGGGGGTVCEQSSASAGFQNGFFNEAPNIVACDLIVAADDDFTLEQITMNQFHTPGATIASVDLFYYQNAAGQPGALIGSETVVPTSQSVVGANFGFNVSEVVLDVTPFLFTGQAGIPTNYWIGATVLSSNGGQNAWESNLTPQGNSMWQFFNGAWVNTLEEGVYIFSGECTTGGGGGGTCVSETFIASGLPSDIDPGGTQTANCAAAPNLYPVTVSGAGIIGTDAELEDVTINITHTWSGDLEIYLRSPSGIELALWDNVGGSGDNFTNTQFQDGGIPSAGSTAPHTGIYAPVGGTFAAAFAGEDINGDWQLKICDTAGGDTGTLNSFTITFCIDDPGTTNNWECADAIALACGDVVTGSTAGATNSGGNASPDVFYSYTGSGEAENVTISLCGGGTNYDSYLRVFASCGNLNLGSEIELNDDFCGLQSQLTFESDGTSTYIIMVEGFSTSSGDFSLAITCELVPVAECGGQFVDSGGPNGNYSNNEDTVTTILPDDPNDYVVVTFTSFNVEATWDALYVYDGPDTSSPLISSGNPPTNTGFPAGGYWGSTIPGPFASTHPSGALTFRFLSDSSVTLPGWVADITCLPVPPPNDLIANAIDVDQFPQAYTDPAVRLQFATNELLNPQGCAIAGTNGVWYKFTATSDGAAEASITTPSGASAVIFYSAPNENVANETQLTYTFGQTNQCGPGTSSAVATVAGQSYYLYVLNTGGESDVVIDLSDTLGTTESVIDGFTFYPNPMENVLNMRANNIIENVVIYNMLGQKIVDQNIGTISTQLQVSNWATGAYLMKVVSDGQTATYRLIKR